MQIQLAGLTPPTDRRAWCAEFGQSLKAATAAIGGLSSPGKMPCHSYGLPAAECGVGSKLRAASTPERPTVCGSCYALKGQYVFANVQTAQYRRLSIVRSACEDADARADFIRSMVQVIGWHGRDSRVFRWHDSGDLQSVAHLEILCDIADALPWVSFWIPTREAGVVAEYLRAHGALPVNLTVRQSAALVGHFPRTDRARDGRTFSAVALSGADIPADAVRCPAYSQGGECGECRQCWDPTVPTVVYPLH